MARFRTCRGQIACGFGLLIVVLLSPVPLSAQTTPPAQPNTPTHPAAKEQVAEEQVAEEQVVDVLVMGNRSVPIEKIQPHIHTRAGRPFRVELVEQDVRRLNKTGMFVDIKTSYQLVPGGRKVIFQVIERPRLQYVKYIGSQKVKKKVLRKESDLKVGDSLDPFAVEEARRDLEDFYRSRGFGQARITVHEGNKPGDRGAVFLIHEGPKTKIGWVRFVGNTIASDARLRTQIRSKPGILWIFKGEYDRKALEEDRNRLTAYYRGLGFFRAKVGTPEVTFMAGRQWAAVTFVIDEGPRYRVRNVSFIGHRKITTNELAKDLKLAGGRFFNQAQLDADVATIQEKYGSVGYIFADIEAQPRFFEQPGELDLVYDISEGDQYRVGRINPQINGKYPHTQITTVLNRISLQPGDIVDIRELRASERRLRACGLFEVNPAEGVVPKIVFSPADAEGPQREVDLDTEVADRPPRPEGFRGQSPEREPPERLIDLNLQGRWSRRAGGGG